MASKTNTKEIKSKFVKSLVAFCEGDDVEAKARRIQRRAQSLVTMAVSSKDNDILKAEDEITLAKEKLEEAIYNNGKLDFNEKTYVENIVKAKNALTDAEEQLESEKDTLAYLKEVLAQVTEGIDE